MMPKNYERREKFLELYQFRRCNIKYKSSLNWVKKGKSIIAIDNPLPSYNLNGYSGPND